jgi:hypothetical protein
MRLVHDHSIGASVVYVPCYVCSKILLLADAIIDADGPAFQAYYCRSCLPPTAKIPNTCNRDGCRRGCRREHE